MTEKAQRALAGVKVLDLSRILAGPTASQLLGDLGADVVKVERPGVGDDTRRWGPPFVADAKGNPTSESAYYLSANRNKRSIAIDLSSEEGQELIGRLLAQTDVLIENYKLGTLDRYGLGFDELHERFPGLVYCSITGFGHTGPYAHRPGYDFLIQGMGGIMSLSGEPDGQPMKTGVGIADVMTGMYATTGILAALRHRDRTGKGQHIDLSLFDSQIAWLVNAGTSYLQSRQVPQRLGNGHPQIVPYQVFTAADGPMILAVGNDAQFERFCKVADLDYLSADERFATNPARIEHRELLCTTIDERIAERSRQDWLSALEEVGVPCGPVNNLEDVFADPHVQSRGGEVRVPCSWSDSGELSLLSNPLHMSLTPPDYKRVPPRLDEHHEEILADWLGEK